jgi:hypothetical protein
MTPPFGAARSARDGAAAEYRHHAKETPKQHRGQPQSERSLRHVDKIPRLIENPGEFPCILRLNGFG